MVKAKLIYYNQGEIVKVIRGNYSGERDCCGMSGYGARAEFEIASERILNNLSGDYYPAEDFEYDCVELYKRNRAGVPRRLVATISMPKRESSKNGNGALDKLIESLKRNH